MKNRRLRILSIFIVVYMIMALVWWAILLDKKNTEAFKSQSALFGYEQKAILKENAPPMATTPYYETLAAKYYRQKWMIYGEACVFGISLIIGIYLINRAFNKELEINRRQNNFLLSVTHELKSPLSSILLAFETIKSRVLNREQQLSLTSNGVTETKRLEAMVDKLLLSAKLESSYLYNLESIDLKETIDSAIRSVKHAYPNREVVISYEGNQTLPADKEAMFSVVQNLTENALKYSSKESIVKVKSYRDGQAHFIKVEDKGIGIPKNEIALIGQKFYRVGSEETRKTKGTGIGLFIVKHILEAHNGELTIYSKLGEGSNFICKIPIK